jgi:hypothetical protein
VVAEIGRDVANIDLAVDGRTGRRINDWRHPGLVEGRVGDAEAGAVGDEASFTSGDGKGEAVEGENGLRREKRVSVVPEDEQALEAGRTGTGMGGSD